MRTRRHFSKLIKTKGSCARLCASCRRRKIISRIIIYPKRGFATSCLGGNVQTRVKHSRSHVYNKKATSLIHYNKQVVLPFIQNNKIPLTKPALFFIIKAQQGLSFQCGSNFRSAISTKRLIVFIYYID